MLTTIEMTPYIINTPLYASLGMAQSLSAEPWFAQTIMHTLYEKEAEESY